MARKKINKAIVLLSVSVLCIVNTLGSTFRDVPQTHWAYTSIADMQKRGIMLVNSSGDFLPNAAMNFFEAADVLAKATGYVDVKVSQNVDEAFKQSIIKNSEAQKPVLAAYESKYARWDKRYNEQIAYLLGRGYLKQQELDKFMTKSQAQVETYNIITKQELAVFVVRLLGKEKTAKTNYKTTNFADDSQILADNKPHVAYLRAIGLVNPDAKGLFYPNTQVTRALCAKMVSDALAVKDKEKAAQTATQPTAQQPQTNNVMTITNIIAKGTDEHWLIMAQGGKTDYYVIKNTTKVTNSAGSEIAISNIPLQSQVSAVISTQNNVKYITSMQIQSSTGTTSTTNTNNTTGTYADTAIINGTISRIGANGDLSITLPDESTKSYFMDSDCVITLDGIVMTQNSIKLGDTVRITVQSNVITKLEIQAGVAAGSVSGVLSSGEVTARSFRIQGYALTIKQGSKTSELTLDRGTVFTRNNKAADFEEIRVGDTVQVIRDGLTITEIKATGTRLAVEGQITAIYIAAEPTITLKTKTGSQTYVINETTDIYDNNERRNIVLRDLRLGHTVELLLESKEAVSLTVQRNTSTGVRYKGVVQAIGRRSEYVDILVDYDPLTERSMVIKRVLTPLELEIERNGKRDHRSSLNIGKDIVVTYQYLEDTIPEKIIIID